jgi:opacity protein-like surface antigen
VPYVTAGGALVNAQNDLIVTAAGVTGIFKPLTYTTLGWAAGAGFEVALWSKWSARLEYLHIRANDLNGRHQYPMFWVRGARQTPPRVKTISCASA